MPAAAFVPSVSRGLLPTRLTSGRALTFTAPPRLSSRATRRARVTANAETDEKPATPATPVDAVPVDEPPASNTPFETPSFDTTVFSDFVEKLQTRVEDLGTSLQDVDAEQLGSDVKDASIGLVDNLLAGDWLNRGELYGAIQLVFVVLLLRSPGFLDGLVGFVIGPATLLAGAAVSGKAVWDLGRKQLSIWPAPVPNGELKTDGLYEYVRHPIYSGLLLASAGFSVATESPARAALTLAFAFFLSKKIEVEEDYLNDAYSSYAEYSEKVTKKLIPGIF